MTQQLKPIPTGLETPDVNFDHLYRWLDSLTVSIPDYGEGDPVSPREIGLLMTKVQNRRGDLARVMTQLERRIGEVKRKSGILIEQRRLEKAEAEAEPRYFKYPRAAREAMINAALGDVSASLAIVKSTKDELEAALRAAKIQEDVLETAKQTLNTLSRIGEELPDQLNPRNRRRI